MNPPRAPSEATTAADLRSWREVVARGAILLIAAIGFVVTLTYVPLAMHRNEPGRLAVYALFVALAVALALGRNLPFAVRAWSPVVLCFGVSTAGLLLQGARSGAPLILLVAMQLGALLFPRRTAVSLAALAVALFVGIGAAALLGLLPATWGASDSPVTWLIMAPGFVLAAFAMTVANAWFLSQFESSLRRARELSSRLEAEVAEKSAALASLEKSQEQNRRLERMEAIGRLAGGVAHDFNNALTAVVGEASLLARSSDPEVREAAQVILDASDGAAQLTRQLLVFSRRDRAPPRVQGLQELLDKSLRLVRAALPASVRVDLKPVPPVQVLVDESQFQHALLNLATNARDAMGGTGTLSLAVTQRRLALEDAIDGAHVATAGAYAIVEVTDTGSGMDAATLARAFEPFFTTKGPAQGTGLGLASVLSIVSGAGGAVGVRSTPGVGTTFSLVLPEASPAERLPVPAPASSSLAGTVLVVEDEASVRRTIARALEATGLTVVESSDADEAFALMERHAGTLRLLVTDSLAPRGSSARLPQRARELVPSLPVILISGSELPPAPAPTPGGAPTASLAKPFAPETLVEVARALLDD